MLAVIDRVSASFKMTAKGKRLSIYNFVSEIDRPCFYMIFGNGEKYTMLLSHFLALACKNANTDSQVKVLLSIREKFDKQYAKN